MPQMFPAWLTSPFLMYPLYAFLAFLALRFVMMVIRRDWPNVRRWALRGLAIALVSYTAFTGYMKYIFADFQFQMPPGTVVVQVVVPMTFTDRIEAIGTTEANESTALTSNATETVKSIQVSEGQFVTAGTVIAQLEDSEEQAALTEAEQAFARTDELVRKKAISVARRDADRAARDVALARVKDRQIVAPFDGILGLRSISVGDIVNPGTIITTLDDVDPIKLEFSVPESYLAVVKPGQNIHATSEAYAGTLFDGTITAIDPRVDPVTRALKAKAEIPNADGKLRAGMLMRLDIVKNARQGLAVAETALVSQGTQKSVMVVTASDKDSVAQVDARPVKIGARAPGYVEILDGLVAGDQVVVEGVIKAHPGASVKIVGTKTIPELLKTSTDFAVPGKQDDLNTAAPEPGK